MKIKTPKGFRLLEGHETIQKGDVFQSTASGKWYPSLMWGCKVGKSKGGLLYARSKKPLGYKKTRIFRKPQK